MINLPMKSRRQTCIGDFYIRYFSLSYDNYLEFYQSQWQVGNSTSLLYVTYRILLALLFSVTVLISIIDLDNISKSAVLRAKWMIYLTNWQFSVATIQFVISAYMVTSMYLYVRKHGEYHQLNGVNKQLCHIYSAIHTISINGALVVSLIYWTMVYDENVDPLSVINILTHAVNAILLLIDCFIICHSIRYFHFYLPFLFDVIYVLFTAIYYHLGGTSKHDEPFIYGVMNWQKPLNTVKNMVYVTICGLILHILVCLFIQLRKRLALFIFKHNKNHITYPQNHLLQPLKEESPDIEKGDSTINNI